MNAKRLRPVLIGSVVVLVLLLVFFAYELGHSQAQLRNDLDHRFRDRADVAATVNEAIFSLSTSQQKALNARRYGGATVDPTVLVDASRQSNSAYAEIVDEHGKLLAATPDSPAPPTTISPLVAAALRTGQTQYSNVLGGRGADAMFQTASAFDTPHGTRVLVSGLRGPLLAAFVNGFLGNLPNVAHASSYVVDQNGKIVGGPDATPGAGIPDRALAAAVASRREGNYGDNRFFTSAPIQGTPWKIVLAANKDDLYASVNGAQEIIPWILFGAFVLAGVLGLFLLRRVFQQNARLQRAELNREHALEINDNIVQRLVVAKYELERGSDEASREKVAETLQEAQQLVTSMLEGKPIRGGVLRRGAPAVTDRPPEPTAPTPEPEDVK